MKYRKQFHELNNRLAAVHGYLQLAIMKAGEQSSERQYVDKALAEFKEVEAQLQELRALIDPEN